MNNQSIYGYRTRPFIK